MSAPKLRIIAARLAEAAAIAPECEPTYTGGRYAVRTGCKCAEVAFTFGTLTVRCRGGRDHIAAVAAKYEKGTRALRAWSGLPARELPGKVSLRRPINADALLAALEAELGEPAAEEVLQAA